MDPNELRLEFGLAVLQQHGDNFLEIEDEFIERSQPASGTPETNKPVSRSRSRTAE